MPNRWTLRCNGMSMMTYTNLNRAIRSKVWHQKTYPRLKWDVVGKK